MDTGNQDGFCRDCGEPVWTLKNEF